MNITKSEERPYNMVEKKYKKIVKTITLMSKSLKHIYVTPIIILHEKM